VSGVTWYEAIAFAEWKGKKLPTIYQWEKAARPRPGRAMVFGTTLPWGTAPEGQNVVARANFAGAGTMPVDSMPFGISPWGAFHMAGNVAEWTRNPRPPGYVFRGGSWNDAIYSFGQPSSSPPFYSSPTLGFRCVKETVPGEEGEFALSSEDVSPRYTAVGDDEFAEFARRYEYPATPLGAEVVERKESADWVREKVRYFGAGQAPVHLYLYRPKGFSKPQVIHFLPAGDVASGLRSVPDSIESLERHQALIRTGRALFVVLLEGYLERPRSAPPPELYSPDFVDEMVKQATDLRRGLDYIQSRSDLDSERIGMLAPSAGSAPGVIVAALDRRYRAVVIVGGGIDPQEEQVRDPACRIHFAPRIAAPKLMLQGRYDESDPLIGEAMPLFALMKEPKKLEVYDGVHVPPTDLMVRTVTRFFDEHLGVSR
jgi:hypothetical protein